MRQMMQKRAWVHSTRGTAVVLGLSLAMAISARSQELQLSQPINCSIGDNCFVQQLPDMAPGGKVSDPFCRSASYDGHKGIDIRLRSLKDVQRSVSVLAAARGSVLRTRDGMPDALVRSKKARKAVEGKECGNGIVIGHAGGFETQYCHLREGSVKVQNGEHVERGDKIGEVGASGLAQFPHVHLALRKGTENIDPVSGRPLGSGCAGVRAAEGGFLDQKFARHVAKSLTELLDFGVSGEVLSHERLVVDGGPASVSSSSHATIAWAWFANVRKGDRIRLRLVDQDGDDFLTKLSGPLEKNKASYSFYAGRRRPPNAGEWTLYVQLLRKDGTEIVHEKTVTVAP